MTEQPSGRSPWEEVQRVSERAALHAHRMVVVRPRRVGGEAVRERLARHDRRLSHVARPVHIGLEQRMNAVPAANSVEFGRV